MTQSAQTTQEESVPITRHVAVLLNPLSGGGRMKDQGDAIVQAFAKRGVSAGLLVGDSREHAVELARAAVADGVDAVVAVGGDGTLNTALQAVAMTDTPLGIIPMGTGNDNAATLGLPTNDLDAAIDIVCRFDARTVDVGSVTTADGVQQYFLSVLCCGLDSKVSERVNQMSWPKGDTRYVLGTVIELLRFTPPEYRITIDGEERRGRGMLAAVGNGVHYGGGMRICEGSEIDDGLLQITWLHKVNKLMLLFLMPKVFKGTHIDDHRVSVYAGKSVHIEAPDQLAYADGDRIGELPVDVEVHPGALRVLTADGK